MLARLHPDVGLEYHWVEAEADRNPDQPLIRTQPKGGFAHAVDQAVLKGDADLAVHSLKDVPAEGTSGMTLAAVLRREDPRDCLITREGHADLTALPHGAKVGTSSPRRAAQLRALRGDLQIEPIRGNVQTRLAKVIEHHRFDATILAAAGLIRSGLSEHVRTALSTDVMLPAAGQAAIAVQCRGDDHVSITRCLPINDSVTATCVHAERQVVASLSADCHSPVAVFMEPTDPTRQSFRLTARVFAPDGPERIDLTAEAPAKRVGSMVKKMIRDLRDHGARELLQS